MSTGTLILILSGGSLLLLALIVGLAILSMRKSPSTPPPVPSSPPPLPSSDSRIKAPATSPPKAPEKKDKREPAYPDLILPGHAWIEDRYWSSPSVYVYRAIRMVDNLPVAVKITKPLYANSVGHRQEMEAEYVVAKDMEDAGTPNVMRAWEYGNLALGPGENNARVPYLSLEDCGSLNLRWMVETSTNGLEPRVAGRIAYEIARALEGFASYGYIHRDLKPENVMLLSLKPLEVRLIDFGQMSDQHDGEFSGTPMYQSPEQLSRGTLTPASDVYSLGMMYFEMLTGKCLFEELTDGTGMPNDRYFQKLRAFAPADLQGHGLHDGEIDLLAGMLCPRPEERIKHLWLKEGLRGVIKGRKMKETSVAQPR